MNDIEQQVCLRICREVIRYGKQCLLDSKAGKRFGSEMVLKTKRMLWEAASYDLGPELS